MKPQKYNLRHLLKEALTSSNMGSQKNWVALSKPAGIFLFNDSTPFLSCPCVGNADEPMEEDTKEERGEKAVTEANNPGDEEVENKSKEEETVEKEEQVEKKSPDEKEEKAEEAEKKNEAKPKTDDDDDDEKGPAVAKTEVVEKDTRGTEESPKSQTVKRQKEAKEQKDKEPTRKAPISSFFGEKEFA